jgi:hypothetical protein
MPAESQNSPLGNRDMEYVPLFKPVGSTQVLRTTDLVISQLTCRRLLFLFVCIVSQGVTFFGEFAKFAESDC